MNVHLALLLIHLGIFRFSDHSSLKFLENYSSFNVFLSTFQDDPTTNGYYYNFEFLALCSILFKKAGAR